MSDQNPIENSETPEQTPPQGTEPQSSDQDTANGDDKPKRRILIGSQREKNANRRREPRDWEVSGQESTESQPEPPAAEAPAEPEVPEPVVEPVAETPEPPAEAPAEPVVETPEPAAETEEPAAETPEIDLESLMADTPKLSSLDDSVAMPEMPESISRPVNADPRTPPENLRKRMSEELEAEFSEMMGEVSMDDLVGAAETVSRQEMLEEQSRLTAKVVRLGREDIFVELPGAREQGCLAIRQFTDELPEVGAELEVIVQRFNRADGLYEVSMPGTAADVGEWEDVNEGIVVEAQVTGHNAGGLEVQVGSIRGFIPISQISLYRVENIEEFVGEKWNCVVTECNAERRNLVVSRRAFLEREREEQKRVLMESLAVGQIHEGTVRKLMDFGAFVDIGGVDGLVHISQLSWSRVDHPSEIVSEGDLIKVRVEKIDEQTGKIGLSLRDTLVNPWDLAEGKYHVGGVFPGRVVKIMDFGAFVELEAGVEGLIHISELAHQRVRTVADVVSAGDNIQVQILSVDTEAKRISLSIKAMVEPPADDKKEGAEEKKPEPKVVAEPVKLPKRDDEDELRGGRDKPTGGEQFGLNW